MARNISISDLDNLVIGTVIQPFVEPRLDIEVPGNFEMISRSGQPPYDIEVVGHP